jgi:hypothetical protein
MKISDLSIQEQKQIDEAPAGMLKQLGRKVGAGLAGAVGMKNTAANLQGKAEVGKTANDVYTKFNKYLGTQQKNVKTATGDDLANFLQNTYNYNQAQIPQGTLNKQQIYDVINKMASDGYAQMGKSGDTAPAQGGGQAAPQAQGGQQQAPGTQPAGQAPAQGQQGGAAAPAGKTGKPPAQAKGGARGPKTAASGATAQIPPAIQKQIDTLTPTEKKALAGMLS